MKRLLAYMLAVIMLLGMVTGCASNETEAEKPAPPEEQTEEQTAEPEEPKLPTREELEEMGFALLADKPLYNSELLQEGLASVQWMDLDGDGLEELLVLSVNAQEEFYYDVTLEVYSYLEGKLSKCDEIVQYIEHHGNFSIKLFEKEEQVYLGRYYCGGGSGSSSDYSFLKLENRTITTEEELMAYSEWESAPDGNGSEKVHYFLHSFEKIHYSNMSDEKPPDAFVTRDEFQQILGSYEEICVLASYEIDTFLFGNLDDNRLMDRLREAESERKAREEQERLEQERKNAYKIVVNGKTIESDLYPKEINGELLVPMHSTFEAMGVLVSERAWEEVYQLENVSGAEKVVFATTKRDTAVFQVYDYGDEQLTLYSFNRKTGESIDGTYAEIDGHSYISLNAVSWEFPASVNVDQGSKTINITSNISEEDRADMTDIEKMLAFTWQAAEPMVESNGYEFYGMSSNYYEGGKRWFSLYVFAPGATNDEVGTIEVAHDGTIGPYEHFGRTSDIFWG